MVNLRYENIFGRNRWPGKKEITQGYQNEENLIRDRNILINIDREMNTFMFKEFLRKKFVTNMAGEMIWMPRFSNSSEGETFNRLTTFGALFQ